MSQLFTQIITQPYLLAGAAAALAFVLGLIIASVRKSGTNLFAALLLWPVSLLRDLLDAAHSVRTQYYMLLLALLGMEAFFSTRASTVYYDILSTRMTAVEVDVVAVIVFMAIFLCGYMVASHGIRKADGTWDWGNIWLAVLVVVHDITGVVYLNYGPGSTGSTDPASISITVGMCAFSLVPFAMGSRAEKLRPDLERELDQEVETFTNAATRTIKRRAVDRVLRLANRTDVIHLVRSLPAHEFAEFKAFVMPIIAPGTPHNLSDSGQDSAVQVDRQAVQISEMAAEIEHLKMLLPPAQDRDTDKLAPVSDKDSDKDGSVPQALQQKPLEQGTEGSGQHTEALQFASKKMAVASAMKANPDAPAKQIAAAAGCSVRTAARWMDKLSAAVTN